MWVCTKAPRRKEQWYLDNGCSRHMTWDINSFTTLSKYNEGGTITFRDDSKGKFVGLENIKVSSSSLIENIISVEGLKYNLLSINQLCDKGLNVIFDDFNCDVLDKKMNSCVHSNFHENNV